MTRSRIRLTAAALLAAALILVAGVFLGARTVRGEAPPATTSAEAGFARDMQVHHNQAVDMSFTVRDRGESDAVKTLAYDIARSQQQQAGQMFGWLEVWGLPQAPAEPSMTWMSRPALAGGGMAMDHGGGGAVPAVMPGFASADDLARLARLSGTAEDRLYLRLMIAHHRGGIEMAQAVLDRSTNPQVTALARSMIVTQESDIRAMRALQRAA
ncbi:uncharacterized protein (DUF305 family) [Frondihabitans sp. PhB188]|uniref:DUF305 domain-containing protein n=1 Tax=Frondihabitans sp. PhB188 TaxID=2485200 RepID=UPI000FACFF49|nr:DUF305 domain-containing protein [Frondihabitans sp. PhB188]ROQ38714.1 uncharacterized protein (DUF305 family) [Frondihabitans sp. PhB188]